MTDKQITNASSTSFSTNDTQGQPLFTGEYTRDTAISEFEKASEVSQAIYSIVAKKVKRKQSKDDKLKF